MRIRELRRRIERRADDRDRMVKNVRSPIPGHGIRRARRGAVGRHGVADLAGDAEHLPLRLRPLEVREVRRPRLLDPRLPGGDVDRPLVAGDVELLTGRFRRHVLTEIAVGPFAFDDDRADGENPVAAAQRRRGVRDDALLGRPARARGNPDENDEEAERTFHDGPLAAHLNARERRNSRGAALSGPPTRA